VLRDEDDDDDDDDEAGWQSTLVSAGDDAESAERSESDNRIFEEHIIDGPTNSEANQETLGVLEDTNLREHGMRLEGRKMRVMRDEDVARYYFKNPEDLSTLDEDTMVTSINNFAVTWLLMFLGMRWMALFVGMAMLLCNVFTSRSRQAKVKKIIDAKSSSWYRATEQKSRLEHSGWLNTIIAKAWKEVGLERQLCDTIKTNANAQLEVTATWYSQIEALTMESITLGDTAPEILNITFENSDVYGEFRLNFETRLEATDSDVKIKVRTPVGKIPTVSLTGITINADFQLLCRLGGDCAGLTLLGVKLNKPLGLDYRLKMMVNLSKTGFSLQKVINDSVNEAMWWMKDPCMMTIPWYPGAGSDLPEANPFLCVGQLEIVVKCARNLLKDKLSLPDTLVEFRVDKSWPLREFKTLTVESNENPQFEHEVWTHVNWKEAKAGLLVFEVYKDSALSKDLLGKAEVPIHKVVDAVTKRATASFEEWMPLSEGKCDGKGARLCVSVRFHKVQRLRAVRMLLSGNQRKGYCKSGVLKLEVACVRNLKHSFKPAYVKFEYGRHLDKGGREYTDVVHEKIDSHKWQVPKMTRAQWRADGKRALRASSSLTWRDHPVGFKAEHDFCIADCRNGVRISIMSEKSGLGSDICLACFTAPTIGDLLRQLGLWSKTNSSGQTSSGTSASVARQLSRASHTAVPDTAGSIQQNTAVEKWLPLERKEQIDEPGAIQVATSLADKALNVATFGETARPLSTGAGEDNGIDHDKNLLRFPCDSTFLRSHYLHPHP
jgi:hypothetical protein